MGRKEFLAFMCEEIKLTNLLEKLTNLKWNDDENTYQYVNTDESLEWCDYEMIDLPNPIPYKNDDIEDYIDGVMIFGDGTIEFHFQECMDAENWARFEIEVMRKIIAELETL